MALNWALETTGICGRTSTDRLNTGELPPPLEMTSPTLLTPTATGVPETTPFTLSNDSPTGRPVALNTLGPFAAGSLYENGLPTVGFNTSDPVYTGVGSSTLTVAAALSKLPT